MKIVVTGGSGRLGQYTVRELLAHGHEVLSLDRVPLPTPLCPAWVAALARAGDWQSDAYAASANGSAMRACAACSDWARCSGDTASPSAVTNSTSSMPKKPKM